MTQDVIDRTKQRKKHCEWPSCIAQKEIANQSVQFWVNSIITGKHLLQLKNTLFFQRWKPDSQILYKPCQFPRNLVNKIFVSKVTKHFTLLFQSFHFELLYYVKDAVHCLLPYLTCHDHTISNTKNLAGFFFFSRWDNLHF